jgi:hypothetical protein
VLLCNRNQGRSTLPGEDSLRLSTTPNNSTTTSAELTSAFSSHQSTQQPIPMPRSVVNRSISFDPELFEKMEARRSRLIMQRSEYVTRCVLRDLIEGGIMQVSEVPTNIVSAPAVTRTHKKKRGK